MLRRTFLSALLGAGLFSTVVRAQAFAEADASPDEFRQQELATGGFALMSSRLALEMGGVGVRDFAPLEIQEQTAIAKALGAEPASVALPYDSAAQLGRLRDLGPGPRFDRMYILGQLAGHRKLLALNSAYASDGADELGRSVAVQALPTIHQHLAILGRLYRDLSA